MRLPRLPRPPRPPRPLRFPFRYTFRSLARRPIRSALTVIGVAAAVFASVGMLALSRGLIRSMSRTGEPENVLVLSKGAEGMEFSAIDPSAFHVLSSLPQVRSASPEVYLSTYIGFPREGESGGRGGERRGVVRGVWPAAWEVHPKVRMVSGRPPGGGGFEVAVGRLVATKLGIPAESLAEGNAISFEGQDWRVSGIFEAPGTVLESEIWGSLDDLLAASKRTDYSAVVLRTGDATSAEALLLDLLDRTVRTGVQVDAMTEEAYYGALAKGLSAVRVVSLVMTVILMVGGLLAGMNTMSASILGRVREIGILLVIGYRRAAVLASFLVESLVLCVGGGVIGCLLGTLLNGLPLKIPMGAFRFAVDGVTLSTGLGLSVAIGVFGVLVPLARVARMDAVETLRRE